MHDSSMHCIAGLFGNNHGGAINHPPEMNTSIIIFYSFTLPSSSDGHSEEQSSEPEDGARQLPEWRWWRGKVVKGLATDSPAHTYTPEQIYSFQKSSQPVPSCSKQSHSHCECLTSPGRIKGLKGGQRHTLAWSFQPCWPDKK